MSLHSLCLAPAIFHHRACGQLIVIAQLLKICPLGFTGVKGLTPGSESVFMSLSTKGFVMNREPQETKAFSKDKQLCSIHQHLHSLPPSLVKTHFLTEIIRDSGGAKYTKTFKVSKEEKWPGGIDILMSLCMNPLTKVCTYRLSDVLQHTLADA